MAECREVDAFLERVRTLLGVAFDGKTTNGNYEHAKEKQALMKKISNEKMEDEDSWTFEMRRKHWPFDDYDEDE